MIKLSEADTRAKLIDPSIHKSGWTEDLIRREETAGSIEIIGNRARRRSRGKVDYVLRVKVNPDTQPVAVALIEAKKNTLPPGHGLDQAKGYAQCKRLNIPFVFSSNGYMFVEFDRFTGLTSSPRPMEEFPAPVELRSRYEQKMGFSLDSNIAKPLLTQYTGGEGTRRYYQDAAIRAVLAAKQAYSDLLNSPWRADSFSAADSRQPKMAWEFCTEFSLYHNSTCFRRFKGLHSSGHPYPDIIRSPLNNAADDESMSLHEKALPNIHSSRVADTQVSGPS